MEKVSLKFKKLDSNQLDAKYSDGCSGNRSDCCTRVCTRDNINSAEDSIKNWDDYLEVNAGVLQY